MSSGITPCPEYSSYPKLLEALLNRVETAYICLLILCYKEIIPSILRANPKLSRWEAEEKVFDALAVLIELLYAYKVKDSVRALLWGITKNKIVDLIIKKVNKDSEGNITSKTTSLYEMAAFEAAFMASDLFSPMKTQSYKDMLDSLTETERNIMDLSTIHVDDIGELDDQAIANQLGLSLKTVQNSKAKIRKKIKVNFS